MENLHRIEGHKQANILFADCTSSNGGMFAGVIINLLIIVTCIVILTQDEANHDANMIANFLRIIIMLILSIACIYAYYIVACLDVNPNPISFLDDLLLFFCLPSFFLYFIVWMAPIFAQDDLDYIAGFANICIVLQVITIKDIDISIKVVIK